MDYLLFTYPNCLKCEALKKKLAEAGTAYTEYGLTQTQGKAKIREFINVIKRDETGAIKLPDAHRPHPGDRPGRHQHGGGVRGLVEIKGIEKFSSRDFPGHISSTVFFGGCTFRCPYCHNSQLVLEPETIPSMAADYFLSYLDGRKGWLEAVCLTGGEPLLHEDIEEIIRVVRERGLLVKLDTNGSFPDRLEALLALGLLDRVAMDVKAPLERYREVTRSAIDLREDRPEHRSRPEFRHPLRVPDDGRPGIRRLG